jgi:hypothetical protein
MIEQSNEATKLRDAFRNALNGPFGPRSLTAAVEEILPQISEARSQRVNWRQIVGKLNEAILSSDAKRCCFDEATLRGIFGRLNRGVKMTVQKPSVVTVVPDQIFVQRRQGEHGLVKRTGPTNQPSDKSVLELSFAQRARKIRDLS